MVRSGSGLGSRFQEGKERGRRSRWDAVRWEEPGGRESCGRGQKVQRRRRAQQEESEDQNRCGRDEPRDCGRTCRSS